ncbi:MAG: VanZ family protein [Microbacter sp.]
MITFFRSYWKTIGVVAVIFYLSIAPSSEFQSFQYFPNEDKVVHFLMYFTLAFVLLWDTVRRNPRKQLENNYIWIWIIGIPALFGGAMELWQWLLTTSRTGDWLDELVDTIGAATGYLVGRGLINIYFKHKNG